MPRISKLTTWEASRIVAFHAIEYFILNIERCVLYAITFRQKKNLNFKFSPTPHKSSSGNTHGLGYDVGGPYATSRNQPKELDEEYKQFAWSRFEQDEPTVEGMSGHWALSCPASLTSYSGFWKETGEPNTFELYDIADRHHVGSIHLYFAGSHTDGRIWLELNDEHMFLYEMSK